MENVSRERAKNWNCDLEARDLRRIVRSPVGSSKCGRDIERLTSYVYVLSYRL